MELLVRILGKLLHSLCSLAMMIYGDSLKHAHVIKVDWNVVT